MAVAGRPGMGLLAVGALLVGVLRDATFQSPVVQSTTITTNTTDVISVGSTTSSSGGNVARLNITILELRETSAPATARSLHLALLSLCLLWALSLVVFRSRLLVAYTSASDAVSRVERRLRPLIRRLLAVCRPSLAYLDLALSVSIPHAAGNSVSSRDAAAFGRTAVLPLIVFLAWAFLVDFLCSSPRGPSVTLRQKDGLSASEAIKAANERADLAERDCELAIKRARAHYLEKRRSDRDWTDRFAVHNRRARAEHLANAHLTNQIADLQADLLARTESENAKASELEGRKAQIDARLIRHQAQAEQDATAKTNTINDLQSRLTAQEKNAHKASKAATALIFRVLAKTAKAAESTRSMIQDYESRIDSLHEAAKVQATAETRLNKMLKDTKRLARTRLLSIKVLQRELAQETTDRVSAIARSRNIRLNFRQCEISMGTLSFKAMDAIIAMKRKLALTEKACELRLARLDLQLRAERRARKHALSRILRANLLEMVLEKTKDRDAFEIEDASNKARPKSPTGTARPLPTFNLGSDPLLAQARAQMPLLAQARPHPTELPSKAITTLTKLLAQVEGEGTKWRDASGRVQALANDLKKAMEARWQVQDELLEASTRGVMLSSATEKAAAKLAGETHTKLKAAIATLTQPAVDALRATKVQLKALYAEDIDGAGVPNSEASLACKVATLLCDFEADCAKFNGDDQTMAVKLWSSRSTAQKKQIDNMGTQLQLLKRKARTKTAGPSA